MEQSTNFASGMIQFHIKRMMLWEFQPIPTLEESANSLSVPVSNPFPHLPQSRQAETSIHYIGRDHSPCQQEANTEDRCPPLSPLKDFWVRNSLRGNGTGKEARTSGTGMKQLKSRAVYSHLVNHKTLILTFAPLQITWFFPLQLLSRLSVCLIFCSLNVICLVEIFRAHILLGVL